MLLISNLYFSFSENDNLFRDLSLTIKQNDIYVLMGSNGAGKSTLFNIITGFYKPSSGNILYRNKIISKMPPYKISALGIGRTFQDLRLISKLSVYENIMLAINKDPTNNWLKAMLPRRLYVKSNMLLSNKVAEIVDMFYLNNVKNMLAGEISYGQQKLLSIACCYASGAEIMLLDELVAGIQPEYVKHIAVIIKNLKSQGKTIVIIEHNIEFIESVADHIMYVYEGGLLWYDSVSELRNDKRVFDAACR